MTGRAIGAVFACLLAPVVPACPFASVARAEAPAGSRTHGTEARTPADRLNRRLDLAAAREGRQSRPSGERATDPTFTGGETLTATGAESGELDRPNLLGPLLDPINPARLHRRLDEVLGFDSGEQSDRPEAPEIPEPVFIEFIRPLGALKYEGELNYLLVAPTGNTPLSHFLEYEYVFADWKAAKIELEFSQGVLETIEPGYQRTLGVGKRHNWVHGFQLNPEVFLQTGFVGGTAVYMLGWKPEEESPFSLAAWLGANRSQFDAEPSKSFPTSGGGGLSGLALGRPRKDRGESRDQSEQGPGAWRTMANLDFWYTLSPALSVGIENDALINRKFGEYLVLPHVNWQPTAHFFVQVGAGFYQLGGEQQAIFMTHVNLVSPTHRKPRRRDEDEE